MDIDTGIATFLPQANTPLDVSAVEEAVGDAGFELLWLELEVLGRLSAGNDETASLTVAETGQRFLLYQGESDEEREGYARLVEWIDQPERVAVVRGRAHAHRTESPAITVRTFHLQ